MLKNTKEGGYMLKNTKDIILGYMLKNTKDINLKNFPLTIIPIGAIRYSSPIRLVPTYILFAKDIRLLRRYTTCKRNKSFGISCKKYKTLGKDTAR